MLDKDYKMFVEEIKMQVVNSNIRAVKFVNRKLMNMYWNIGETTLNTFKDITAHFRYEILNLK